MTLALIPGLGTVGPMELIILLSIILLVFGAKRIPELARGLGSGVREFKKGTSGAPDKDKLEDEKQDGELTANATATDDGANGNDDVHAKDRPAERAEQKR